MAEDITLKVVLLGETAVGKSCIITRFISDVFQTNHISTMVGSFFSKDVFYEKVNKKIKYVIWDTAGQEKYRSMNKMFYQNASVIILVLDITRKETFEAIKNYWYGEVKKNVEENTIIALAANKCDLYEYEEVSNDELEKYAQSIGAIYKQTSALNNTGINDMFNNIGYKILSPENYEEFIKKSSSKKQIKLNSYNDNDNDYDNDKISDGTLNTIKTKKKGCC